MTTIAKSGEVLELPSEPYRLIPLSHEKNDEGPPNNKVKLKMGKG